MDALARARQEIAQLSSLPVMDGRLLKIIGEPEAGSQYEQLGALLHADPALAARVLKVANSAFFGGSRAIDSIRRALEVLGHRGRDRDCDGGEPRRYRQPARHCAPRIL